MSATSTYSNLSGTMSESFSIGKRGVKLLQGISDPTGVVSAPAGSIYIRRDSGNSFVYQIDYLGNWTALLSPSAINQGTGIDVSSANGIVTIALANSDSYAKTYRSSFTNSSLTANSLTVAHNLGKQFVNITVTNGSNNVVTPDNINMANSTSAVIDFTTFGSLSGTWHVSVIG